MKKPKLPRALWRRRPATQVVPNKKAAQAKRACRNKAGPYAFPRSTGRSSGTVHHLWIAKMRVCGLRKPCSARTQHGIGTSSASGMAIPAETPGLQLIRRPASRTLPAL
ncbi:MAG: hypothetical protein M0Z41_12665 [Peptococcaceae bacterium]|jgi:hypothetical protein|nr:hypothetical protein [Peptococcaceae bacterium]